MLWRRTGGSLSVCYQNLKRCPDDVPVLGSIRSIELYDACTILCVSAATCSVAGGSRGVCSSLTS